LGRRLDGERQRGLIVDPLTIHLRSVHRGITHPVTVGIEEFPEQE
jgi:hypothetical protein